MKAAKHVARAAELLNAFGVSHESPNYITLVTRENVIKTLRSVGRICGYSVTLQFIRKGEFSEDTEIHKPTEKGGDAALESYRENDNIFDVKRVDSDVQYVVALIMDIKEVDGSRLATSIGEVNAHVEKSDLFSDRMQIAVSPEAKQRRLAENESFLRLLHKPVVVSNKYSIAEHPDQFYEWRKHFSEDGQLRLFSLNGTPLSPIEYIVQNPQWDERVHSVYVNVDGHEESVLSHWKYILHKAPNYVSQLRRYTRKQAKVDPALDFGR